MLFGSKKVPYRNTAERLRYGTFSVLWFVQVVYAGGKAGVWPPRGKQSALPLRLAVDCRQKLAQALRTAREEAVLRQRKRRQIGRIHPEAALRLCDASRLRIPERDGRSSGGEDDEIIAVEIGEADGRGNAAEEAGQDRRCGTAAAHGAREEEHQRKEEQEPHAEEGQRYGFLPRAGGAGRTFLRLQEAQRVEGVLQRAQLLFQQRPAVCRAVQREVEPVPAGDGFIVTGE